MPDIKDLPDNYPWLPGTGRYPMPDAGELAARLESIVTFDRRGSVVLIDRCIHGVHTWQATGYGTGSGIHAVAGQHMFEPYSIALVAGSDGASQAQMVKTLPSHGSYVFGYQISFRLATAGYKFQLASYVFTGTELIRSTILVNLDDAVLQYRNEANGWTTIATIGALEDKTENWNILKYVIDTTKREYVRVILNNNEHSLADIPIRVEASVGPAYKWIAAICNGGGGDNPEIYINDFIFTIGE